MKHVLSYSFSIVFSVNRSISKSTPKTVYTNLKNLFSFSIIYKGNTWDQTLRDLELTGVRMSDGSRVQIENILSTLTISTAGSDDQIALDKVASSLVRGDLFIFFSSFFHF